MQRSQSLLVSFRLATAMHFQGAGIVGIQSDACWLSRTPRLNRNRVAR